MVDPNTDKAKHDLPTIFNFKEWIKANTVYESGCNNIQNTAYTVRRGSNNIVQYRIFVN